MKKSTSNQQLRIVPSAGRSSSARERLVFNYGPGTVPGRGLVDAALANDAQPTFATAAYAEPRDWGYLGLLAFTIVLLLRPQDQIPGLAPLHLAEVCAIVGILPMLVHRVARRLPVFRVTPETVGLALFGLAMLATVPFSIWPGGAMQTFIDSYLKIVIVFALMMNTLTTPRRLEQITWVIVLCCGYIAALAIVDYARGMNLAEGDRLAGPVSGMFGNPNDLALTMVTFLPAAAIVALTRRYSMTKRIVAAAVTALMMAAIVFTKSRGGALGFAATLGTFIFLGRKVRPSLAIVTVAVLLAAAPLVPASFWSRMSSIVDEQQDKTEYTGSRETRLIVMQEGLDAFASHPFTGVGAGQFKNYNPPERQERWRETHNALLQVAAETGIFGLLAFAFLIIRAGIAATATRRMLSKPRKRSLPDPMRAALSDDDREALYSFAVAMTAGLVGWFVCSLFASVAYSWTFYYLLALIVAARELTQDRLRAARALQAQATKPFSVPSARFSSRVATGAA